MKNKIIKNLAINLAFFQFFSMQAALGEKDSFDYSLQTKAVSPIDNPKSNDKYILVKNDEENPIYLRFDTETGEYRPISIFDYDNINSKQYGASQENFRSHFDQLIKDPLIWEEMQNYYPVEKFQDIDEAMFFYRKYFDIIYDCGCGYAVAANFAFHILEGHEDDFYKAFGYPMYTINNNIIDFNYEVFILKFFNYSNLKINNAYKLINQSMEKDMWLYRLKAYTEKNKIQKIDRKEARNWTSEQWDEWYAKGNEYNNKIKELQEKVLKSENKDINLGITIEAKYGNLNSFLANHGIHIKASYSYNLGKPNVDDIIASDGYKLYKTDKNGSVYKEEEVDLHYVYISEIKDDGMILVSSWGNMYIFDNKDASMTKKIVFKMSK